MAAFERSVAGRTLTFARGGDGFDDGETGSRWSIEGVAEDGPLKGTSLTWLPGSYVRWHAWVYCHRGTQLFRSTRQLPTWPDGGGAIEVGTQGITVLDDLVGLGYRVEVERPLVAQLRPRDDEYHK